MKRIKRFENWFNVKFGWFFTNGRKTINYTPIMKGTLHKTESGWVVQYWDIDPYYKGPTGQTLSRVNELPLHPDDCERFHTNGDSQSCTVEFEVVLGIPPDIQPTNGSTLGFEAVEYAKLI